MALTHQTERTRYFNVAGISFVINSCLEADTCASEPCYREFCPPGIEGAPAIPIEVHTGPYPETTGLPVVFDSGSSWVLYASGDDRLFVSSYGKARTGPYTYAWFRDISRGITAVEVIVPGCGGLTMDPVRYPIDQIVVSYAALARGAVLVHAAGVITMQGRGYVFPGVSGAGKTTLSRLFMHATKCEILSDDRMIVEPRKNSASPIAWGTPWAGDAQIGRNRCTEVSGVLFPLKGAPAKLTRLTPFQAFAKLLPVSSVLWYEKSMAERGLEVLEGIASSVAFYDFTYDKSPEALGDLMGQLGERVTFS